MPTAQSTSSTTTSSSIVNKNKLASKETNLKSSVVSQTVESSSNEINQEQQQHEKHSGGNKTPQEQPEFVKQVLIIIEKKVRNLEKRRQKLDDYKASEKKGTKLNEDQLLAVSKYEEVMRSLELSRELEKQFVGLANDAMKQQKKQAKKEQMEREESIKDKLKESQKIAAVLNQFGNETIRNDFLNETNGAIKITSQELRMLDEFDRLIEPSELGNKLDSSSNEIADHLVALIESKNKPITQLNQILNNETNVTYADLKKLFDRILTSTYWTIDRTHTSEVTNITEQTTIITNNEQLSNQEITTSNVNELPSNLNGEQTQQHQQIEEQRHLDPSIYQQQNTSDDFVLVTSNDYNNDNTSVLNTQKSPVNQGKTTFFTTLNPADLSTQFLNRTNETTEDTINFLQDSEIQLHQQEQQNENYQQSQVQNQQEFSQNENQKDTASYQRYPKQSGFNGNRGPYQQRPRYQDDRRSAGGMPRQNSNGSPFNNQNNNRYTNGTGNNNYRNQGGNRPENRTGGGNYYRGGPNNTGRPNNSAGQGGAPRGNYRNQHQQHHDSTSNHHNHNQQPLVQ